MLWSLDLNIYGFDHIVTHNNDGGHSSIFFLSNKTSIAIRLSTNLPMYSSTSYSDNLLYAELGIRWKDANGVVHLKLRLLELSRIESHILGHPHLYLDRGMRVHIPNVDTRGHDKISITLMGKEIYCHTITCCTLWLGILEYAFFLLFIPKQTIKTTLMCLLLRAFSEAQVRCIKTKSKWSF